MKIKTSELIGPALDWAVAKAEGFVGIVLRGGCLRYLPAQFSEEEPYTPSTDWSQGGPIIERAGIATRLSKGKWYAMLSSDLGDGERAQWSQFTFVNVPKGASTSRRCRFTGSTQLEAGLRCFVASKLGDEVDVPEVLL